MADILQGLYPVIRKIACAKQTFDMTVACPEIAQRAEPGQFLHIRVEGFPLRRPISICEADKKRGTVRMVFEVRGEGTAQLAQTAEGSLLDVMGPLGKGFALLDPQKKAVVVGGGIGVPPLLAVAKHYQENAHAILGFRSANAVILEEDFAANENEVHLCTDDGTRGREGVVTEPLKELLSSESVDIVYACGPKGMLQGVAELAAAHHIRCQLSLEERMGCGIGACLVCACKTKKADGKETFSHVCKDGPVFEAEEVVF